MEKNQLEVIKELIPNLEELILEGQKKAKDEQNKIESDFEIVDNETKYKVKTFEVITGKLYTDLMAIIETFPMEKIKIVINEEKVKNPDITITELATILHKKHKFSIADILAFNKGDFVDSEFMIKEMIYYFKFFQAIINPFGLTPERKEKILEDIVYDGTPNDFWMSQNYDLIKKKVLFFRKKLNPTN